MHKQTPFKQVQKAVRKGAHSAEAAATATGLDLALVQFIFKKNGSFKKTITKAVTNNNNQLDVTRNA